MTRITRRAVLAGIAGVAAVGVAGCSSSEQPTEQSESTQNQSEPTEDESAADSNLTLTSTAFDDGEQIPTRYGYEADNVNPPLTVENVPDGTESLALIVDDPDAVEPAGKVWDHWVVWNISPDQGSIPEGWTPAEATAGTNDYGEVGYGGPNPPDAAHRYRFRLFALDTTLELPAETDADALETAIEGHIVARAELDGTYPA